MDWVLCPIRKYASPFPLYRPFLSQLHSHMNRHDIRPNFRQKVRTLRHCNNTLPRGGMFWKISPLRQSRGPRGANCRAREGGVFCCFPIHSDSRQCISIFFFKSRSALEITSRVVLTVHNFNTLPFYKKELPIPTPHLKVNIRPEIHGDLSDCCGQVLLHSLRQ